ncbi:helix-turn-helix domain-containing protein [Dongia sp.]|uniref:helix-turn-helix domain-containing protein n=1 Tax=Dongia sp. TaxID=1977262 RepID=UPI0035AFF18A
MASRKVGMFGVEPNEFMDDRNEDGVAALLRRRREELGRDIPTVARQLRIRAVYISAIEDGRLQDLPGTAYAVGFVRAYADYLGLDGNSVVGDYRDELARRSRQNQLIWPVDQVEHKHFPGGAVLIVSFLILGALVGGWYMASQPGGTGIDLIDQVPEFMKKQTSGDSEAAPAAEEGQSGAAVPESDVGSTPASAQAAQTPTPTPTPAPAPTPAAAVTNAQPGAATEAAPTATEAAPAATVEPAADESATEAAQEPQQETQLAAPAPVQIPAAPAATEAAPAAAQNATPAEGASQTAAVPAAPAPAAEIDVPAAEPAAAAAPAASPGKRIVLRATKDSWVEIFGANDEVVLQRILRAGESFVVPDQPGLTMNTGNAGGVVIELDGKARPALGSVGVVKRGVKLDPTSLTGQ